MSATITQDNLYLLLPVKIGWLAKLDSDYVINNEYKINNAVNRILDIMKE